MKVRNVFLLKGIERMIDHVKSLEELKCAYWKKARNKKFQVGDICFLYLSGKGHNQIRYCLEVVDTDCRREDAVCWKKTFRPDNHSYKMIAIYPMYQGQELSLDMLESIGIKRHTQFRRLDDQQADILFSYFE
nr:hypothetical protein [uncultured Alistipes sp.]